MSTISDSAKQSALLEIVSHRATTRTHLPTVLPLAFPSPLHTLNTLTTIHLIHAILAHPSHSEYFAETDSTPSDTALSAVLGLYLSSSEDWTASNLLSTAAWKSGKLDANLIAEIFRIQTTREEEHETLKGIKVGGRWEPGARLVEELKAWFAGSAGILGKLRCVGEWVGVVVEDSWKGGDDVLDFVKNCCDWVCLSLREGSPYQATSVCPPLNDIYPSSCEYSGCIPLTYSWSSSLCSAEIDIRLGNKAGSFSGPRLKTAKA